jgi:hypothetical protein
MYIASGHSGAYGSARAHVYVCDYYMFVQTDRQTDRQKHRARGKLT